MFIRIGLLVTLSMAQAQAKDVEIGVGLQNLILQYDVPVLSLQSSDVSLTLKKTPCNTQMITSFNRDVDDGLVAMKQSLTTSEPSVRVKSAGKDVKIMMSSVPGRFFMGLTDRFHKLKIQNKLKCRD